MRTLLDRLTGGDPCADCRRLAGYPDYAAAHPGGVTFVDIDGPRAIEACRKAVKRDKNPDYAFLLGRSLFKAGELGEALHWFEVAVKAGDVRAYSHTAALFLQKAEALPAGDEGRQPLQDNAIKLLRGAAAAGDLFGRFRLGLCLAAGTVVERNLVDAGEQMLRAAEGGFAPAMATLATMYEVGQGMPLDLGEARRWIKAAAEKGDAPSVSKWRLHRPLAETDSGLAAIAFADLLSVVDSEGSLAAQRHVALCLALGQGCETQPEEAMRRWRAAAEAGDAESATFLARMYREGVGVPLDFAQAMHWYQRGAELGDAHAAAQVGNFYQEGLGVEVDSALAAQWFERAGRAGSAIGWYNLAGLHFAGRLDPSDEARGIGCLMGAADLGMPRALYDLAVRHRQGRGLPKNHDMVVMLAKAAGLRNYPPAFVLLGHAFLLGQGCKRDHAIAGRLYRDGVERGEMDGYVGLAAIEEERAPPNLSAAHSFYLEGAQRQNVFSMTKVGRYARFGLGGTDIDLAEAHRWLNAAATLGDEVAMQNLGDMYRDGEGVPVDLAQAEAWYRRAAAAGRGEAMYELAALLLRSGAGVSDEVASILRAGADKEDGRCLLLLAVLGEAGVLDAQGEPAQLRVRAQQALSPAAAFLEEGRMHETGLGMAPDRARALSLSAGC